MLPHNSPVVLARAFFGLNDAQQYMLNFEQQIHAKQSQTIGNVNLQSEQLYR